MGIQKTMSALSDGVRRDILNLLKKGKMTAGAIVEHFSISAPAISRHLSVLKDADLIRDERDGKFIYYQINISVLEEVMLFLASLKGDKKNDKTK